MAFFKEPLRAWLQRLEDTITSIGSGSVGGPGSSTLNAIALWANTLGTAIKNSLVTIDSSGSISLPSGQTVDGRDVSVDGAALDAHIANTSNPHSVDATDVGLGSVTNDAQLKRSADDWSGFATKATPVGTDLLLIEDQDASGAKKKILISGLGGGGGGGAYLESAQGEVSTDITTTSTSYVDMTGASVTMTLGSGEILIARFAGQVGCATAGGTLKLVVDGVDQFVCPFKPSTGFSSTLGNVGGAARVSGLSAGSRTVKLQWKADASATLTCNAASDTQHNCFLIVERVSV